MSDPIRWCFTHDHRYDEDASRAAFTGECDTDCEKVVLVKTMMFGNDRQAIRDTLIESDGMDYDVTTDRIMELFEESKAVVLNPEAVGDPEQTPIVRIVFEEDS